MHVFIQKKNVSVFVHSKYTQIPYSVFCLPYSSLFILQPVLISTTAHTLVNVPMPVSSVSSALQRKVPCSDMLPANIKRDAHIIATSAARPLRVRETGTVYVCVCPLMMTHFNYILSILFSLLAVEQLRVHVRRHKGMRKFECSQCGYKFTRQVIYLLHVLSLANAKPSSQTCRQIFMQNSVQYMAQRNSITTSRLQTITRS